MGEMLSHAFHLQGHKPLGSHWTPPKSLSEELQATTPLGKPRLKTLPVTILPELNLGMKSVKKSSKLCPKIETRKAG